MSEDVFANIHYHQRINLGRTMAKNSDWMNIFSVYIHWLSVTILLREKFNLGRTITKKTDEMKIFLSSYINNLVTILLQDKFNRFELKFFNFNYKNNQLIICLENNHSYLFKHYLLRSGLWTFVVLNKGQTTICEEIELYSLEKKYIQWRLLVDEKIGLVNTE